MRGPRPKEVLPSVPGDRATETEFWAGCRKVKRRERHPRKTQMRYHRKDLEIKALVLKIVAQIPGLFGHCSMNCSKKAVEPIAFKLRKFP